MDSYSPTFADDVETLDRDATILIYCRTGNRTGQTYETMMSLGFEWVYDLDRGITEWIS